jgi:hypothetical protein
VTALLILFRLVIVVVRRHAVSATAPGIRLIIFCKLLPFLRVVKNVRLMIFFSDFTRKCERITDYRDMMEAPKQQSRQSNQGNNKQQNKHVTSLRELEHQMPLCLPCNALHRQILFARFDEEFLVGKRDLRLLLSILKSGMLNLSPLS